MNSNTCNVIAIGLLAAAANLHGQTAGFHVSSISTNGILKVQATDTYYDGNNGTLFQAVPLPPGATHLQFRVTGGVITDGSERLASADGLYANLQTPYDWTATTYGTSTYKGVFIGATTGVDPALFGIFLNPAFTGKAPDSANFRSDNGVMPDPRTLPSYAPLANQPVYIGDGYTTNNAYVTNVDTYVPPGTIQTYTIPPGATELVLGIGADQDMSDNVNAANTNSAFQVHVFDDSGSAPVIASISGAGTAALALQTAAFSVMLSAGGAPIHYQWYFHGTALQDGGNVAGSQSNTLTLSWLQYGNSGLYQVVVSNAWGVATASATLGVYATGHFFTTNVTVAGNAEIHGAGNAGLPDSSGVEPVLINLPANSLAVYITNVSGTISLNGNGGQNDADGVVVSGGGYPAWSYSGPYGGISGIKIPGAGALVGVYEPATAPASSTAPDTADYYSGIPTNFTALLPLLYQTFFIGDGLMGDGGGSAQLFQIPQGATRLFLGIPDAGSFDGPPGGYSDNSGAFTVTVKVLVADTPSVTFTNVQTSGTNFSFSFPTLTGQSYTVETSTNIGAGSWTYYTNVTGNGSGFKVTLPSNQGGARFFRVEVP